MCVAILCVDKAHSDAFASVIEQDQNVPSESKHRNSHGMAWVVVFPCGHRNDSVGVLLNHLRNAAPSALSTMDHQRILAPWPLVMCERCRWTPECLSILPAGLRLPCRHHSTNSTVGLGEGHLSVMRRDMCVHILHFIPPFHPSPPWPRTSIYPAFDPNRYTSRRKV